ncbi:MAG TPA: rhodanese-like domain-containing protein [Acidimicrobiia bacterium]|nr:rhodanese-like domain-containing protein [Acidimicrobiia bacterium]
MRKTVLQMWAEANEKVEIITPAELAEELESGDVLLLDVRHPKELERSGTIDGSVPVPRGVVEWWADPDSPYFRPDGVFGDFDQRVVAFCDGGGNGAFTAVALQELGYRNAATLEGGFHNWVAAGLPTVR